jgi:two-component system sensor histidine kinase KdpD
MEQMKSKGTTLFARVAASVGAAGLVAFLLLKVFPANSTTAALAFMLLVLVVSAVWTIWEALAAALAATLALDYFFFPPWGFRISDPNDVVALVAFVVCAIIASQLGLTARSRTAEANRRQDEMERLYALSRAFMLVPEDVSVPSLVVFQLVQLFGFHGVALFLRADNQVYRNGPEDVPLTDDQLREASQVGSSNKNLPDPRVTLLSLAHDGVFVGSLVVLNKEIGSTTLHAIANLTAIALFRATQRDVVRG